MIVPIMLFATFFSTILVLLLLFQRHLDLGQQRPCPLRPGRLRLLAALVSIVVAVLLLALVSLLIQLERTVECAVSLDFALPAHDLRARLGHVSGPPAQQAQAGLS